MLPSSLLRLSAPPLFRVSAIVCRKSRLDKTTRAASLARMGRESHHPKPLPRRRDLIRAIRRLRVAALTGYTLLAAFMLAQFGGTPGRLLVAVAGGALLLLGLLWLLASAGRSAARTVNFLRAAAGRAELEQAMWRAHQRRHHEHMLARVRLLQSGQRAGR
jgi:hypothetical protein